MPEGHTVHRTANHFNEVFGGKVLEVISPQGRFSAGAAQIDGLKLIEAWAVGKQMFLNFENDLTLRIHLGIYGKWNFAKFKEVVPEPVGQVRVRFIVGNQFADLRGPTACDLITTQEALVLAKQLGPDPLNPDSDSSQESRFVQKITTSKRAIGLLLMDQSVVAGIGNVYRAELLFRARLDPYALGSMFPESVIRGIWHDAETLMKVGVATGIMITRDELLDALPAKVDRYFVYKREGLPCRVCGTEVSIALMASRKLYWCTKCQTPPATAAKIET